MKAMMQSRYVTWMAIRPLPFGDKIYLPGEKVPQALLEGMRDPEVLVRTNRLAAVAKDMNKVPRYLRKQVTDEAEMRAKILAPHAASQMGPIYPTHLIPKDESEELDPPGDREEPAGDAAEGEGDETVTEEPVIEEAGADGAEADSPQPAPVPEEAPVESQPEVAAEPETPSSDVPAEVPAEPVAEPAPIEPTPEAAPAPEEWVDTPALEPAPAPEEVPCEVPVADPSAEPAVGGESDPGAVPAPEVVTEARPALPGVDEPVEEASDVPAPEPTPEPVAAPADGGEPAPALPESAEAVDNPADEEASNG